MTRTAGLALLAVALAFGRTAEARAQARARATTPFASVHVAPDHWAMEAARRLAGLGLVEPGFDWGERALPRRELAVTFREAARRAEVEAPRLAALARAYLDRFADEFGPTAAAAQGDPRGVRRTAGAVSIGYDRREGEALAGIGYDNDTDWTGPLLAADVATAVASASVGASLLPYAAASLDPEYRSDGGRLRAAQLSLAWKDLGLWIGRRAVGFGPGAGGGIVLSGASTLDGAGIHLLDPIGLPGPMGRLGPVRFHALLSRIENGDRVREPWFWAARAALAPHPRIVLGLSRGVMFGGEGNSPWTPRNLAYMLIGKHSGHMGEFDNQVFAVDVLYRPPLRALPLVLYLEWGMDDSAGALRDVPGFVAGAHVPALPGLPAIALRVERASFAASCCGNTIWYRNWAFRGGWTDASRPLGHPLGGHGTEWLAELRADLLDARLRLAAAGLLRHRGAENVFAPDREGRASGARIGLDARPASGLELFLAAGLERGDAGWRRTDARAGARWLFP